MNRDYGVRNNANLKLVIGLTRTIKKLDAGLNPLFRKAGITPGQFDVLEVLYHKGNLTVNEVVIKTLSTGGNIGLVIDNLVGAGLVRKTVDETDRRIRRVEITGKARILMDHLFPAYMTILADVLAPLDDRELSDFTRLLKKVSL